MKPRQAGTLTCFPGMPLPLHSSQENSLKESGDWLGFSLPVAKGRLYLEREGDNDSEQGIGGSARMWRGSERCDLYSPEQRTCPTEKAFHAVLETAMTGVKGALEASRPKGWLKLLGEEKHCQLTKTQSGHFKAFPSSCKF